MTEREELEMWKSMYLRLLRGTEEAIGSLTRSEAEAESLYIEAGLSGEPQDAGTADAKP